MLILYDIHFYKLYLQDSLPDPLQDHSCGAVDAGVISELRKHDRGLFVCRESVVAEVLAHDIHENLAGLGDAAHGIHLLDNFTSDVHFYNYKV